MLVLSSSLISAQNIIEHKGHGYFMMASNELLADFEVFVERSFPVEWFSAALTWIDSISMKILHVISQHSLVRVLLQTFCTCNRGFIVLFLHVSSSSALPGEDSQAGRTLDSSRAVMILKFVFRCSVVAVNTWEIWKCRVLLSYQMIVENTCIVGTLFIQACNF